MTPQSDATCLRVSTDKQGRSGLGIEAQREAVTTYLNGGRWTLVAEYVETESGRKADRPKLGAALSHAKAVGAKLVFAKLDRLTRNVDLLRSLVASDVDLVFCDLPSVPPGPMGKFLLTQMASVAELEAGLHRRESYDRKDGRRGSARQRAIGFRLSISPSHLVLRVAS